MRRLTARRQAPCTFPIDLLHFAWPAERCLCQERVGLDPRSTWQSRKVPRPPKGPAGGGVVVDCRAVQGWVSGGHAELEREVHRIPRTHAGQRKRDAGLVSGSFRLRAWRRLAQGEPIKLPDLPDRGSWSWRGDVGGRVDPCPQKETRRISNKCHGSSASRPIELPKGVAVLVHRLFPNGMGLAYICM
jgi:hypothetical protein